MLARLLIGLVYAFLTLQVHAQDVSLGTDNLAALKGARRIAIDQFGVEFITQLKANGTGGGSSASVHVALAGVSDQAMQEVTDKAYNDTVASLTAAGFDVVPMDALLAQPEYQALAEKNGHPSPYEVDDSRSVSRIVAPTGMRAFFQTAGGDRGSMSERFTALNGANGARSSELARSMGLHFVRFHFLASFGTAAASGGFLANFTGKARASVEAGPNLMVNETQAQIISQEGQRIFLTTSRSGVNGAVYLSKPLQFPNTGFALKETTTAESRRSDGLANALSIGLAFLSGNSASQTRNSTAEVHLDEATFKESYSGMIAAARDAMVARLKSAAQ